MVWYVPNYRMYLEYSLALHIWVISRIDYYLYRCFLWSVVYRKMFVRIKDIFNLKCRKKYKGAIYFTYMTRVSIDDITCNILMVSVFQDLWSFIPNYCDYDHSRSLTLDILTVYSYTSLPSTYSVLKFKTEMLKCIYWEYMACAKNFVLCRLRDVQNLCDQFIGLRINESRLLQWSLIREHGRYPMWNWTGK